MNGRSFTPFRIMGSTIHLFGSRVNAIVKNDQKVLKEKIIEGSSFDYKEAIQELEDSSYYASSIVMDSFYNPESLYPKNITNFTDLYSYFDEFGEWRGSFFYSEYDFNPRLDGPYYNPFYGSNVPSPSTISTFFVLLLIQKKSRSRK